MQKEERKDVYIHSPCIVKVASCLDLQVKTKTFHIFFLWCSGVVYSVFVLLSSLIRIPS